MKPVIQQKYTDFNWVEAGKPYVNSYRRWIMIRACRQEYYTTQGIPVSDQVYQESEFENYLKETWGIEIKYGYGVGDYDIVDNEKHLLFLMKYAT